MITLDNGITLDESHPSAIALQEYAHKKGLKTARAFLSSDRGNQSFLLVIGTRPEYESQSVESVAAHIDMLSM